MRAMATATKYWIKALTVWKFLTTTIITVSLMRRKRPYRLQQELQMHQITSHFLAVRQDKVSLFKRFMASSILFQMVLF